MSPPAAAVASVARIALREALDYALPPRCPACGEIVAEAERFCLGCWRSLAMLGEPCCTRCGLPFAFDSGGGEAEAECGACLARPPPFDRLRAAVAYGETARKVALKLKYSGRPGVAGTLAHLMLRHLDPWSADDPPLLVPVPLHRWRMWKRGYNQAALIASELARRSGAGCALGLLRRRRATPSLRGLNRRERALAVRGAFEVADERRMLIEGRRVVLVDDVFTSGATASACARALRRAGARSVEVLCWARVVRLDEDGALP
jgi:ComF family protein